MACIDSNKTAVMFPVINHQDATILTLHDCQRAQLPGVVYDITPWLMRPGIDVACQLPSLMSTSAFTGMVILDARGVRVHKKGYGFLHDPLSGARIQCSMESLLSLLRIQQCPVIVTPMLAQALKSLPLIQDLTLYIGEMDDTTVHAQQCDTMPEQITTTALACLDAKAGIITYQGRSICITDAQWQDDASRLSNDCSCQTCVQGAKLSYLHHLYLHTPLLCYRLLAWHNLAQY